MMMVRMAQPADAAALLALAQQAGVGMTSFMPDAKQIEARIARSVDTVAGRLPLAQQGYLFVLEDTVSRSVAGVSGIEVAVGLEAPWYNYRIGRFIHSSRETGVLSDASALFLSNDHTGFSELCTLFLAPEYRRDGNGALLSKARLMFVAAFRDRFATSIVAEMRGVIDEHGRSPFWEAVCRPFFHMDFSHADRLVGLGNKSIIAELMPRHPIYTALLPEAARAVIGAVHPHTAPARALLESEGLRFGDYIDIFDGGATLEARIDLLRIVKESPRHTLDALYDDTKETLLISNTTLSNFRIALVHAGATSNADLSALRDALQAGTDEHVRTAPFRVTHPIDARIAPQCSVPNAAWA